MATGSMDVFKYFRPVGSLSSSTIPTLPDPDGPLSERVPAKAIELANAEVKQSKESPVKWIKTTMWTLFLALYR